MENKMQGGALPDKWHKKVFGKKHVYSGLVNWPTVPTRTKPSQRFQTSPTGDSASCVAQSKASHVEVVLGVVVSAEPIYINRSPKTPGMSLSQADDNMYKIGTGTEALIPSQKMTDAQLDVPSLQPTPFKATGKGVFVSLNADAIADAINQFEGVSVTFGSNESEWDGPQFTPRYNGTPVSFYHCIFFYDFYMDNGVKTFLACDSDGLWSSPLGERKITENFLLKRATGASYSPGFVDTTSVVLVEIKDPTNTYPLMTPETTTWWQKFWYYLRGK